MGLESTSYSDLGVFECYRQLSLEIYNAFGIEIPPEEIEPHIVNCAVKIGGRSQGIADIKNRVYLDAAEKIASRVRNVQHTVCDGAALANCLRDLLKHYANPELPPISIMPPQTLENILPHLAEGDFRNWEAVRAWASEIHPLLAGPSPAK